MSKSAPARVRTIDGRWWIAVASSSVHAASAKGAPMPGAYRVRVRRRGSPRTPMVAITGHSRPRSGSRSMALASPPSSPIRGRSRSVSGSTSGQSISPSQFAYLPKVKDGISNLQPNVDYLPYNGSTGLGVGEVANIFLSRLSSGSVTDCPRPQPCPSIPASLNPGVPATPSDVDNAQQQIAPRRAMGSEYVAVRYRNRVAGTVAEESVPWRLIGMVNGTSLTWEPSAPPGAPSLLSLGQIVEFCSPGPFVVRSQDSEHPFLPGRVPDGREPLQQHSMRAGGALSRTSY